MSDNRDISCPQRDELLDIFNNVEDQHGTDLLSMSDFSSILIKKIETKTKLNIAWEVYRNLEEYTSEIATAIKSGFDISKKGMLVADYSHFSKEIIDGIKAGIYHVGQSKEVAGNLRPAILNEKERLVKFFTLKRAYDPTSVLADISTLAIQASLHRISSQIEDISRDINNIIDANRRETLSNKFLCARDRIMSAANADGDERIKLLMEADTYLMEGLTSLYSDLNAQVKALDEQNGPFARIKSIDRILSFINDDMQMIPRYVGLRVYLLNYRNKTEDAKRVLGEYRYQLQSLSEKKIGNGKYTAFELIHRNYPYNKKDPEMVDFWLEKPKQMLSATSSFERMLEPKTGEMYYIDLEEDDEQNNR